MLHYLCNIIAMMHCCQYPIYRISELSLACALSVHCTNSATAPSRRGLESRSSQTKDLANQHFLLPSLVLGSIQLVKRLDRAVLGYDD